MKMRKELEDKLNNRFNFFGNHDSLEGTQKINFFMKDGWFNLLWQLSLDIEKELLKLDEERRSKFYVYKVGEKYGGFYCDTINETAEIIKLIDKAEDDSYKICEVCGAEGREID